MKKLTLSYQLTHMLFWSGYAIIWSYTAVYLQARGYQSQTIGMVTGIGAVISVLLQPFLAGCISKNSHMSNAGNVMLLKIVAVGLAFLMMQKLPGLYTVAVLFTVIAAVEATIPSILSSIAMECVNEGIEMNYGVARGLGSVCYAVCALFLGYAVSFWGEDYLIILYVLLSILNVIVVFLFQRLHKKECPVQQEEATEKVQVSMLSLLKKYPCLKYFFAAAVLFFMSHNMLGVFLPMIIEQAGGDSSKLGIALAISAMTELPVMSYFAKLSKKISTDKLLIYSGIFFTLKSAMALVAGNVGIVYLVQFLQFGGFALFTPASVYFINEALDKDDCNVGQALLGACTLGLGGTFGNILGGMLIDFAGLFSMLLTSTILCGIGLLLLRKANLKKI